MEELSSLTRMSALTKMVEKTQLYNDTNLRSAQRNAHITWLTLIFLQKYKPSSQAL